MRAFTKRFITVRESGRYFNVSPVHVEALIRCGRIRVFKKEEGVADGILVDLDSAAKFKQKLDSSLTSIDIGRWLGVSIAGVDDLSRHGCLQPLSGPAVDGLPEWRFDPDETNRLLGLIGARIVTGRGQKQRELISWAEVLCSLVRHKISVGRFVRDVLDGILTPCFERPRDGLTRFGFSRMEINDYIRSMTLAKTGAETKSPFDFELLARALERRREENERFNSRGPLREGDIVSWINAYDIARIANCVLYQA